MKKLIYFLLTVFVIVYACSSDNNEPEIRLKYNLTTEVTPVGGGTISPSSGSYSEGQKVTLTAKPSSGYTFKNWSGAATGSELTTTVTMSGHKKVTAVFEKVESNTIIIKDSDWINNIVSVNETEYTFVFKPALLDLYNLNEGDFIVSSISNGYLRQIKSVSTSGNQVTIKTDFASISEAFKDLKIKVNQAFIPDYDHPDFWMADGFRLSEDPKKMITDGIAPIEINRVIFDLDNDLNTTNDQTKVTGTYSLSADMILNVDYDNLRYNKIEFGTIFKQNLNLKGKIGVGINKDTEFLISQIPGGTIFVAGVVLTPVIDLYAGAEVHASGSVETEYVNSKTTSVTIDYNGSDWKTSKDIVSENKFEEPSFSGNAEVRFYVKPKLSIKFYGTVAPNASSEISARAEAQLEDANLKWASYLGLNLDMGIEMKILTKDIFDYSVRVYDEEWLIKEGVIYADTNPEIKLNEIKVLSNSSVELTANISDNGGSKIVRRGFYYGLNANIDGSGNNDTWIDAGKGSGSFTKTINGLKTNTTYYFVAYSENEAGLKSFSEEKKILTESSIPVITINKPEDKTPYQKGDKVIIEATAKDSDASIKNVSIYIDNIKEKEFTSPQSNYSYTWDTSEATAEAHKIKVIATDDTGIKGEKEITVTVRDGNLEITQPNSQTVWQDGDQNKEIKWNTGDLGGKVSLELYQEGEEKVTLTDSGHTDNDGSFSLDVDFGGIEGKNYRIRIASIEFPDKFAFSSNFELQSAENLAPIASIEINPKDKEEIDSDKVTLAWNFSDPENDDLTYDVYFGTSNNPPKVTSIKQKENRFDVLNLNSGTAYFWYIIGYDGNGNNTKSEIWTFQTIENQEKTFVPDDVFEDWMIKKGYDDVMDNYVITSNISNLTELILPYAYQIKDFTGIEGFKNIEYLFVIDPQIKILDLSNNPELKRLELRGFNAIESLIIDKNFLLEEIYCPNHVLSEIDVRANIALKKLYIKYGSLTSLDVKNNRNLTELNFSENQVTSIDVSQNNLLSNFSCYGNPLSCIQVNESQKNDRPANWYQDPDDFYSTNCSSAISPLDSNGLTPNINNLVPTYILDEMKQLGMDINTGGNPPNIANSYYASPFILEASNIEDDTVGYTFASFYFKFYDLNFENLTLKLNSKNADEESIGIGSFLAGNGSDFTVFSKVVATRNGEDADLIYVISGTIVNGGIENMQFSNFMLDNKGNPTGSWIDNGSGRVIHDSDGFSPIVDSFKRLPSKKKLKDINEKI